MPGGKIWRVDAACNFGCCAQLRQAAFQVGRALAHIFFQPLAFGGQPGRKPALFFQAGAQPIQQRSQRQHTAGCQQRETE